jgi:ribonuclease P protein component
MKRPLRFTGEAAFVQHRRSAKRSDTANFTAFVLPSPDVNWRFAAVASKRIGGAVQRNKAKRRLRAAFAQIKKECEAQAGENLKPLGVILYAKSGVLKNDFQEIVETLRKIIVNVSPTP